MFAGQIVTFVPLGRIVCFNVLSSLLRQGKPKITWLRMSCVFLDVINEHHSRTNLSKSHQYQNQLIVLTHWKTRLLNITLMKRKSCGVRLQILMASSMKVIVFWEVGNKHFLNVDKLLPHYTAQYYRRQPCTEMYDRQV